MAWERGYYYRKEWHGGKVRSVYVGGGSVGELAALMDLEVTQVRAKRTEARRRADRDDSVLDDEYRTLCDLVTAMLLTAGYHTHKREWRKRREPC